MATFRSEDTRGRRTEDMDDINYTDSTGVPTSNNGGFYVGSNVHPGFIGGGGGLGNFSGVSGRRTSRGNRRTSRQGTRESRGIRTTDNRVSETRLPNPGDVADLTSHSGLEGYARYVAVPGEIESYDSVCNDMESSELSSNMNNYCETYDNQYSHSASSIDKGLEGYARYLGASMAPEGYQGESDESENFRLSQDTYAGGRFEFSSSSRSDFAGLGSYGQPYIENEDMEVSRGQNVSSSLSSPDHYGYGDNF